MKISTCGKKENAKMVCDKIIFGGKTILKVYHTDFSDIHTRKIICDRKFGRFNLEFHECTVPDDDIQKISGWISKEEGLLEPGVFPNPYGDRACTSMVHYIYDEKPTCLFKNKEDSYSLKISIQDFIAIAEFTEKYTGVKVQSEPMVYGDTFVFGFCDLDIKANEHNGITIKNIPSNATLSVVFKNNDIVVHSDIVNPQNNECIEINCDVEWNNHDLYMYVDDKLIYSRKNLFYFRNFSLKTQLSTNKTIPLRKIADEYVIKEYSSETISSKPEQSINSLDVINKANRAIIKLIDDEKPDKQILFISPGEFNKAMIFIGETLESAKGELWIFDPYFTDSEGLLKALDWLRIIVNCNAGNKNIVFFSKDPNKCLEINDLRKEINKDANLQDIVRRKKQLGICFHQTKSPIHDRFILVRNGVSYGGMILGTSFNSLDSNHYCLTKLSGNSAKTIYTELTDWLNSGNEKEHLRV